MRVAPLPLAPRPYEGESISSWVRRMGARYDITADDLVRCILGWHFVAVSRAERLDHWADAQLEDALAVAARIDRARISNLRVVCDDGSASCWHRQGSAWCTECIRDDIARHGEVHERAIWRLGCCVLCPVHDLLVQETCCQCTAKARCYFRCAGGRLQLVCDACGRQPEPGSAASRAMAEDRTGAFGILPTPRIMHLIRNLQSDLLAALAGCPPRRAWGPVRSAKELIAVTRALTITTIRATGMGVEPRIDLFALASGQVRSPVYEPITLAALTSCAAFGVMAVVATFLETLAPGNNARHDRKPVEVTFPLDAPSFLAWLPERERNLLHCAAADWEGETGRAIRAAIDRTGMDDPVFRSGTRSAPYPWSHLC